MRTRILVMGVSLLAFAAPRVVVAQRLVTWSNQASTRAAPLAIAEPNGSHRTWAGTGTLIGGVGGALVGAAAFIHFTYRNGSLDNATALTGVGMVSASLLGSAGALVGRLIGSAIER